jgi:Carboxypeptidase regulatory-like domain
MDTFQNRARQQAFLRALAFLLVAGFCAAQPQGSGMIAGVIVQKANGEPVRKAIISLTWHGNPRSWATAMTDGAGRFKFEDLPAGKYSIDAWKDGAGRAAYGGETMRQLFEYVTLAEGQRRSDIVLRMIRPAYISGTVLDEQGDPMVGATISLWMEAYPRGTREIIQQGNARSNDRGEYRMPVNDAGRFYLSAGDENQGFRFGGTQAQREMYARQFYGGATDWKRATPITVAPGDQIRGIDLHLSPLRSFTLRGRIAGVPELPAPADEGGQVGKASVFVNIQLGALSESGQIQNMFGTGVAPPDYKFEFQNILPGRYRLSASMQPPRIPGQTAGPGKTYWASQKLDLVADPGEITIAMAPAVDIKGQVRAEGGGFEKNEFKVALTSPDTPSQPVFAKTGAEGRFTLEQVPPGIWDIGVEPIPPGGYIKSMRFGKQDVLTEDMEIGPGSDSPLIVVMSSRGGKIDGEISDPAVAGHRAIFILLAPTGRFRRVMSFFNIVESDSDGKFKLRGITPGTYKLLAFQEAPPGDPRNPDLVERLGGETIEIAEGEMVNAKVDVITAAQLKEALK